MRAKLRALLALSAVLMSFALGLAVAATAQASTTDTRYSSDGQWKATFSASANSYIIKKTVGTEVHTYHREWIHGTWFTSGHYGWVERPVARIVITNSYKTSWNLPANPRSGGDLADNANRLDVEYVRWWYSSLPNEPDKVAGQATVWIGDFGTGEALALSAQTADW